MMAYAYAHQITFTFSVHNSYLARAKEFCKMLEKHVPHSRVVSTYNSAIRRPYTVDFFITVKTDYKTDVEAAKHFISHFTGGLHATS